MFDTKSEILAPLSSPREAPLQVTIGTRNILGVRVSEFSKIEALSHIANAIKYDQHLKIAFLNAHGANVAWVDEHYVRDISEFIVLADGIGVDVGSLINFGQKFPDNLNGTDFIPALFNYLEPGQNIALLGAAPGIAEIAAMKMQSDYPQHNFVVINDGFFSKGCETEVLAKLSGLKPNVLLVAMGNPAQEKWIAKNCTKNNCTIVFGVGAYFDFAAGSVTRAPYLLQKLRFEWAYRLWLEPQRLWRRYILGNPMFIIRSFIQKFGWRPFK